MATSERDLMKDESTEELESEQRWDALFARSGELLSKMAAEAIREDDARKRRANEDGSAGD